MQLYIYIQNNLPIAGIPYLIMPPVLQGGGGGGGWRRGRELNVCQ